MMHFYKEPHRFYCGVDLHTRSMYLCVQDHDGKKLLHQDYPADPQRFLQAIAPFRDDLVVGCECTFSWYWLADLCLQEQIRFVLGHALYMKAIHGGKNKSDKIDSDKIVTLLRGGMFPVAYVYPAGMRETRDLLRRRMHLVHIRGESLAHIQNTNSQYNLPPFPKKLCYARNRADVAERFTDDSVRKNVQLDLDVIGHYDGLITDLELYLVEHAKLDDAYAFQLLRSVPGIGKILSLVLLYEIHQIGRFPSAGDFLSYARLISGRGSSAGKPKGVMGRKIGNAHLKWAFSEAAVLMIRESDQAKRFVQRLFSGYRRRHDGVGRGAARGGGEVSRMPTIDFAQVRARVPIARVLELVGFRPVRRAGAELRGPCPIHRARSPRSRSFAANIEKNVFHCFHCGVAGNVLDLWAAVHQTDVYRAAVELCERLNMELPQNDVRSFNPGAPGQARARRSNAM